MGNRIKEVRIEKGITQLELANRLGVTRQAVSNLERNESVTIASLEKVASALGCYVHELYEPNSFGRNIAILNDAAKAGDPLTTFEAGSEFDSVRQSIIDHINDDYIKKLSVPALKLNEAGRETLLTTAEAMAANEDMTK